MNEQQSVQDERTQKALERLMKHCVQNTVMPNAIQTALKGEIR